MKASTVHMLPRIAPVALIALIAFFVGSLQIFAAENHPTEMVQYFEWCGTGQSSSEMVARYEGFWARYYRSNGEYADAIHARYVRLCAYKLVELYAREKAFDKIQKLIQWLRDTDNDLRD